MATLVLSTVGTVLGGPVGGAIGGLLGQSIDQQMFGQGPNHGPRLGDLSVQTSSYGTAIPKLFGTIRVAGSIVWSTDLQEASQTQGAKGQPETVTYSYSASFAVALSSRPILDVRRIWADGKLIRTAEGEFAVSTGFRLLNGSEEQAADPLIATIEGPGAVPAYRGLALAVFEDLDLSEFGNRIPFLTFEAVADPAPVPASSILNELSEGAVDCSAEFELQGYAAHGTSVESAAEPLVEMLGIALADTGTVLASPGADTILVASDDYGCSSSSDRKPRTERSQTPARALPAALDLSYYDPEREYQAGLARASIESAASPAAVVALPAVIGAAPAKGLAETTLARRWAERDKLVVRLPPSFLALRPGTLVSPAGAHDTWRAERVAIDGMVVRVDLRPVYSMIGALQADAGRVLSSTGVTPTPTILAVVELPDDGSGSSESPVIAIAASGSEAGWRPVPLEIAVGEAEPVTLTSAARAVQGHTETALGIGQSALFDMLNTVDVALAGGDDWLESRDDGALADGVNLALIGSELIQFGNALPLGEGRFRLSRLLRGRRGTEWAMALHQVGDPFVMISRSSLQPVNLASNNVGARIQVVPRGLADATATPVELIAAGDAMRPPSPVHLRAAATTGGGLRCSWTRRSRKGWAWLDFVDVPVDGSPELYRATLRVGEAGLERETNLPNVEFSAADLAELGPGDLKLSVVQIGELAASRPAQLTIA